MNSIKNILVIILLTSCNYSRIDNKGKPDVINIDLHNSENMLTSALFDSIKYIALEDKDDASLIKHISKIEFCDSLIFILDRETHNLHCFNLDGQFIKNIGKTGQGPGEYIEVFDFSIDYFKKEILILDRPSRRIILYGLDGKYKESSKIKIMANKVAILENNYLFYTAGSDFYTKNNEKLDYNLFITDKKCNIINQLFKYDPEMDNFIKERIFDYNIQDSTLLFHYSIYDTIYSFDNNANITKYAIIFNNNKTTNNKSNNKNSDYHLHKSEHSIISGATHSSDYTFVNYARNNRMHVFITTPNKSNIVNINLLKNDIDKTTFFLAYPLKIIANRAYFIKSSTDLLFDNKKDSMTINRKVIKKESNPVLIIGYLK